MGKIRVVLADDHTLVREGFRSLLKEERSIEVVGEASDGREAVVLAKKLVPDVIVLDISMPLLNGIQATQQIRKSCLKINVLILSMHRDEEYVREVFHAGAGGYLLKHTTGSDLVRAIQEISRGNAFISPTIANQIISEYRRYATKDRPPDDLSGLTPREMEILQLISEGYSNKKIAEQLFISVKTVGTHRQKIMDVLKIHDVAGLTRYAIAKHIIEVK